MVFIGLRLVAGFSAAVLLTVATGSTALAGHDPRHGEECTDPEVELGPLGDGFACGEILVRPADPDQIEAIVVRHGGDPEQDVIDRIDMGPIAWFVVAVDVGSEPDAVEAYRGDPDVVYAELNSTAVEVAGSPTMPNTTTASALEPEHGAFVELGAMIIGLLLLGGVVLGARRQAAHA